MSDRQSATGAARPAPSSIDRSAGETAGREGLLFGILAYTWWGLIPLYFKTVDHVPPLEVLAHRVIWSCAFLAIVVSVGRRWTVFRRALGDRKAVATLAVTTVLIASNWFTYIYAISSQQVLQASLGYFITPLANVLLGVVFLGERMRRLQIMAVLIAIVGVVTLAVLGGEFPWIAIGLAVSFSFYGLLRKTVKVDGLMGLMIETLILAPLAIGCLAGFYFKGDPSFHADALPTDGLLMLGGVVTAVPLLSFAAAARRLRLATLGFLQYLAPTIQFLLAVLAFGEPFSRWQIASFACIWTAIVLYTLDSLAPYRKAREMLGSQAPTPTIDTPVADAVDGM